MLTPSKIYAVKTRHPQKTTTGRRPNRRLRTRRSKERCSSEVLPSLEHCDACFMHVIAIRASCKCTNFFLCCKSSLFKHPENIQSQRIRHQRKQQDHPHHLRIFDELITRLPSRDHLPQH